MPSRSSISLPTRRWIVMALCSLAHVIFKFEDICFERILKLVLGIKRKKTIPYGGCPYLYSGGFWETRYCPFNFPKTFWDDHTLELATTAYLTGLLMAAIPAGLLSDIGYSRCVLCGGAFMLAACRLGLALVISTEVVPFTIQNFCVGVARAMVYTSIFTLISRWSRPSERVFFTALVLLGDYYGLAVGRFLYWFIHGDPPSWTTCPITSGILWIIWVAFAFFIVRHSPYSFIRQREVFRRRTQFDFIMRRLGRIPWHSIFTSRPFLSLVLAFCCVDWAAQENIRSLVTYQDYILHLPGRFTDKTELVIVAAAPTVLMGGWLSDWIVQRNYLSNAVVKKAFVFVSLLLSTIFQAALLFAGCNIPVVWVLSLVAVYVLGVAIVVIFTVPMDLCLEQTGLLMGILLTIKYVFYILFRKINSYLINDFYVYSQWKFKILFYCVISMAMMLPFVLFGSVEEQYWMVPRISRSTVLSRLTVQSGQSVESQERDNTKPSTSSARPETR